MVCGSHGGVSFGRVRRRGVPVGAVFFNDAGGGKDEAGRAWGPYLDQRGIAAGTVAHDTAMIGDALETFESGVISAVNERARAAGFEVGRGGARQILRGARARPCVTRPSLP